MPIINNPAKKKTDSGPAINKVTQEPNKIDAFETDDAVATATKTSNKKSRKSSVVAIVFISFIGIGVVIYGMYPLNSHEGTSEDVVTTSQDKIPVDPAQVSLDLRSYSKLSSLASLSKKEIEVNTITLIEAQNTGSSVTMNAVEVILNSKKKDLAELKKKMGEVLEQLYTQYMNDPILVVQLFREAIEEANSAQNSETVRLLEIGVDALENVPPIVAPKEYFKGMLAERL